MAYCLTGLIFGFIGLRVLKMLGWECQCAYEAKFRTNLIRQDINNDGKRVQD